MKLGDKISVPKSGKFAYDFTVSGSIADFIGKTSEKHVLEKNRPFTLPPNQFILAQTLEIVGLPTNEGVSHLAARIERKSSLARCGLLVHFTAPTVHPGWMGPLTLEITNLSKTSMNLHYGMPIAQLIIEEVRGRIFENLSQFQGQSTPEGD